MQVAETSFEGAGGVRLVADVAGPSGAPPVVLLHGGGQTRHSWSGALARLVREGYRVVNLDLRGHGDSDWSPDGDYGIETLAADVLAVAATFGRPSVLVGASLGGVAAFYATGVSDSRATAALIMVDIALRSSQEGTDRIGAFMAAHANGFGSLEEAATAVADFNPGRRSARDHGGLLKNLRRRADGRLYWHWDPRILLGGRRDVLDARHSQMVGISAQVTVPTLLVRGERSDVVSHDNVQEMQRLVPQTEVVEVPGAGHMVAGDRNDAFSSGIIAFLRRNHPARADPPGG